MTRNEAYQILIKYLNNQNLIKHCLATEVTMRTLAGYFKEDVEKWGVVGLLHDADYEMAKGRPEVHGLLLFEKEQNIPDDIAYAIKSHNYEYTKVIPQSNMDWSITACDQLTGLIVAAALIHPEKNLAPLTPDFILKRFNEKSFAKGAKRKSILLCESKLHIPLLQFITLTLSAMQSTSQQLGL